MPLTATCRIAILGLALLALGCQGSPPAGGGAGTSGGGDASPTPRKVWEASELHRIVNTDKKLRIGLEPEFQPFEFKDEAGQLVGFDVDLGRLLGEQLGVPVEFTETKWEGIIPDLLASKYDLIMSGLTGTPERGKTISFSTPYFYTTLIALLNKANDAGVTDVRSLDQPGKTIVVKRGTTSDFWVTKRFTKATINRVTEESAAALEVAQGRADCMIYDRASILKHAADNPGTTLALDVPLSYEPYCIGMRKGDIELKNWIDHALIVLENDGTLADLHTKWFGDAPRKPVQ